MAPHIPEPILHPTPILDLKPTQMTLGMQEVKRRRDDWGERDAKTLGAFLRNHMVPVVLGPGREPYLTDHHHLARALYEQDVKSVFITVIDDLSKLDPALFWNVMDFRGWTHPYDGKGRRRPYSDLPKNVKGLQDDPYRSLAGELRAIGGFAKDSTPFSEFLWADFLRLHIKPKFAKNDFKAALKQAFELSRTPGAEYLPGWCAPRLSNDAAAAASKAEKIKAPAGSGKSAAKAAGAKSSGEKK